MQKPAIPNNESSRIEQLHSLKVLDTPAEERFDRLTRLARRLFEVPIALVSLVDENRQWFKSRSGLEAIETPRDISFCGHAINQQEIFEIVDASKDPRFQDNPLVTEAPSIRFYAGIPLLNSDGSAMGTFCIIDNKPRELSEEDRGALKDLATMAANELVAVQMATIDELTCISNRRGFMMLAQKGLDFCKRQSLEATLLFLDLDKFKVINDCYGHAEGDQVLKTFANLIQSSFRESDVLGRYGGDEFVVLLINSSLEQSRIFVERLQRAVDEFNKANNKEYDIGFSTGKIAISPIYNGTLEDLLENADSDMYKDKNDSTEAQLSDMSPEVHSRGKTLSSESQQRM